MAKRKPPIVTGSQAERARLLHGWRVRPSSGVSPPLLRPSVDLRAASADDLALRVGETARDGAAVYMGFQNNLGLVAGPQTGKTTSTMGVISLHFPGPAIMTETHRPDVMAMSACQSDFDRPVLVLDPENRVGWPDPAGIDILSGTIQLRDVLRARRQGIVCPPQMSAALRLAKTSRSRRS